MAIKVGVGGTFNIFHRGHRALLDKAFEISDHVVVGITSDKMAQERKDEVVPLSKRQAVIESYLRTKGSDWSIEVIDRPSGKTDQGTDIDALVVSPETVKGAEEINRARLSNGLTPLRIITVPHYLADDFLPVSASRIKAGQIDMDGRLLRPLRVNVGSDNRIKLDAVVNVIGRFYDRAEVKGVKISTGLPDQPRGEETRRGAMERARLIIGDADLGIGLEAGVFETEDGLYDIQYCAILDRRGRFTIGHGSGFRYPPDVAAMVRTGLTVGEAFRERYGWERDGKKIGAIGFLTNGILTRTGLTEQAITAAMVPRIKRELYPDL